MEESSSREQRFITISQFVFIIFGAIVGIQILSLPNGVVKIAHQDGWISTLIGGLYPIYVALLATYISKKHPNDTILTLSKRYFGNLLGSSLNFIFATYFIFMATSIASYYTNLIRSFMSGFLTPFKIIAVMLIVIIYAASKGLKNIGTISGIAFYITILFIFSPVMALRIPQIINIYPMFGSGFNSIVEASVKGIFAYSGAEIILLIYPFVKEKGKMLRSSLISIALVIIIYTWTVFITIYYLGPDIVNKSYWSYLLVTESVTITVINNYRYIFILLWSLIVFKTCAIYCYGSAFILKDLMKNIEKKKIYFLMYPLFVYLALKYGNEMMRQSIGNILIRWYTIFNLLYITAIAVFIFFKGGAKA